MNRGALYVIIAVLMVGGRQIQTLVPLTSSSIAWGRGGGSSAVSILASMFGAAAELWLTTSMTAGTNDGASPPPADLSRASRRHANSSCGVSA